MVYFSRFAREDIYMACFTMLLVVSTARYLRTRNMRWILLAVLVVVLPTAMIVYMAWSTAVDDAAMFGTSLAVALLAVLLYPLCRRFVKGDRPDAEIDSSQVELGPDRFAGYGSRKAGA